MTLWCIEWWPPPRGLCHTQVCCIQRPCTCAGLCWPVASLEALKHSSVSVSVGSLGLGVHKIFLSPLSVCWVSGLILNMISPLLTSCWVFSFVFGCRVSFFGGIQHSPVNSCSTVSCSFAVLTEEDEHSPSTPPSYVTNAIWHYMHIKIWWFFPLNL